MIAFIDGEVISLSSTSAVIKVSGLGYKVTLCKEDVAGLSLGQKTQLFIHTNVREDALELYGFTTNTQKELFLLLIGISGVGPKLAINIASFFPQNELVGAILEKDIGKLSSIPGIGKKTAERISLELKDKVTKLELQPINTKAAGVPMLTSLQQAMRNLGFSKDQFNKAVLSLDENELSSLSLEDLIKKTLNALWGKSIMTIVEEQRSDILKPASDLTEIVLEESLRPRHFSDYVGQKKHLENLMIMAQAAKSRHEAMDHCLLFGPPGLGKTTLANIIAQEMGRNLHVTSGPALEKKGDLAGILTNLKKGDVLFIDEIHRLNAVIEENLYPAMEEFRFDIVLGEGPHARIMPLSLEPFTLVGATTKTGLLTSPLRDRFGFSARLEYYSQSELTQIITRSAKILKIEITPDAAMEIASRSRGTPRISNRLLKRMRDFAQVLSDGKVTLDITQNALKSLGVDESGLDIIDNRILTLLCTLNDGAPIGLETIAASLSESSSTIEDVYEPYLLQQGYIIRTPRGRQATRLAYNHLGIEYPREYLKEQQKFGLFS